MDEEEYETIWIEERAPSRRFRREDIFVLGANFLYRTSKAVTDTLGELTQLMASHANHGIDQDIFAEEAALEIETLIAGEEEDG